jgi:hypothetical protein
MQHLAMRQQRACRLEIGPAQRCFDLGQIKAQLPVKKELLQHQELRLFVEPVTVRTVKGRLQQIRLVVEMKRPHGGARHFSNLFDGVRHRHPNGASIPSPFAF